MKLKLEYCIHCGRPTERAGKGEDSLYAGSIGPLCDDCYDEIGVAGWDELEETFVTSLHKYFIGRLSNISESW